MSARAERLWLAAITAVAAAVRFTSLETLPPGVALDEGRMALLAQAVLRGEDPRPWLHSIEVLAWIPSALLFAVLPDSIGVLRLVPAFWGTLTVPALWWAVRPASGPVIALAAAAALAVLRWHVALSRLAVSGYFMPLAAVVAAGCLLRAVTGGGSWWWIGCGFVTGFGMHTYPGARVLPLILGAGVAGWWWSGPTGRRRSLGLFCTALFAGALLGGWYVWWHPERFLLRVGEVGQEIRSAGQAFRQFRDGLGALNVGGNDLMHTFPAPGGSALLGVIAGLLWIPGLVLVWRGAPVPGRWLLVAWTVAGFAGGVFSGPHGMRQFLLAPLAALSAAAAAVWIVRSLPARWIVATAVVFALGHAGAELWRYAHGRLGGLDPRTVEWVYRGQEVAMAARLRDEAARRPVFWSPAARDPVETPLELFAAPTIFLSTPPVRRDLPATRSELAALGGLVAFPMVSALHLALLREVYPGGELWYGTSIDPRKLLVYAVGAAALARAKLPLDESPGLFRPLWSAERAIETGRPAQAAELCRIAALRWPRIGGILTIRAAALLAMGRPAECVEAAGSAIRLGAAGGRPYLYLGGALLKERNFAGAATALERAARLEPDLEEAWLGRVAALANDGRPGEAMSVLREALSRFPDSVRAAGLAAQLNR